MKKIGRKWEAYGPDILIASHKIYYIMNYTVLNMDDNIERLVREYTYLD